MSVSGDYLGMHLLIEDVDRENLEYFASCARGEFRLQRGAKSGLLRYPPTTACPWTGDRDSEWVRVEGRGTVHSYTEVHHPIQPAFRDHVPYMVLLVELDTQSGEPSAEEGLRVAGNLVDAQGELASPERIARVGIGSRMRMVFRQVNDDLALPMWALDEEVEQPVPWRYPEE